MPRKRRQNDGNQPIQTDPTNEIVKKVKSLMLESIVREWLNSPCKEWGGKTPLGMIKKGEGQKILDALRDAEAELKEERTPKKEELNGIDRTTSIEESIREEREQTCYNLDGNTYS